MSDDITTWLRNDQLFHVQCNCSWPGGRRHEAADEIERLRAGYAEAIQDLEDWAAYADDYYKEKWDLAGDLERHRRALKGES